MPAFKYVNQLWRHKQSEALHYILRVRCWEYRQLPAVVRLTHPTRPEKAHRVGYKARQGVVVYRIRVRRGGRKRGYKHGIAGGKPRNMGINGLKYSKSLRAFAEEKAGRALPALRVLNSYWVAQDGCFKWYDVIMVDASHKAVRADPQLNWICDATMKHRELRGLTYASKCARGMRHKGVGTMKNRPSKTATWKRHNLRVLRRYR